MAEEENRHAGEDFEAGTDNNGTESSDTGPAPPRNPESNDPEKNREVEKEAARELPSQAAAVHQRLRIDGQKELSRDSMALLWSAIAAGISMSFSMVARGLLHAHLPATDVGFLIECLGYTVGFVVVILARQQLFTENTVTAVLPVMSHPTLNSCWHLARLWGVVLVGNIVGAAVAAFTFQRMPMFDATTQAAFVTIGQHMMANTPGEMFGKGILAGWMIATLVWVIPSADQAKLWVITLITYVMALGGFTHIIVGSSEALYLALSGHAGWSEVVFHFALPTLAGNIIGGTFIFALISHAQIRGDLEAQRERKQGLIQRRHPIRAGLKKSEQAARHNPRSNDTTHRSR
ncbi:formate/nitrite transporter FocA (FNT family) [Kushneria sinocarnis]|uniref:Formate/nitrite transporter FocA (FNT family) n=1 Tax=Kushneria sinocarnis TaxID=595502 RepID=A0A420WUT8_9GAMM|nr:formate/nitrite transporter family protein [Kushneria sinocarnis]RKQ97194.1 formate/nitrite transporter FocA (FNT family) [Kushneria sinocarnis]